LQYPHALPGSHEPGTAEPFTVGDADSGRVEEDIAMNAEPTADRLRDLLDYNPETGEFRWRKDGRRAGAKSAGGYLQINIDQRKYTTNKLAWLYVHGQWPTVPVQYVNGIVGDDRIANLQGKVADPEYGNLTADRLRAILDYNADAGVLTYKRHPWKGRAGTPVPFAVDRDGYLQMFIEKKCVRAHRICWMLHHGRWPENQIDHINGNPADNRICNLREATNRQNCHNKHRPYKRSKSGVQGVHWDNERSKWRASIAVDYKSINLGRFDSMREAIEARDKAKASLHPFGVARDSEQASQS
jgi:hypothetical protein